LIVALLGGALIVGAILLARRPRRTQPEPRKKITKQKARRGLLWQERGFRLIAERGRWRGYRSSARLRSTTGCGSPANVFGPEGVSAWSTRWLPSARSQRPARGEVNHVLFDTVPSLESPPLRVPEGVVRLATKLLVPPFAPGTPTIWLVASAPAQAGAPPGG
jgi:hypothetical protein